MKLLEGKGFILHASSVIDKQGKVHIFLAPSGGGKSTTAAHLVVQGMSFGTDDSIVFRKKRGGWTCYSSGMVEKTHLPKAFVATKFSLYFLQKSEHLLRAQFPRSIDSMKALMRQLWMLESKVDKETYLLLTEFISQARLYRLSLPLNSPQLSGVLA